MNKKERDVLLNILVNHESLEKIAISCDQLSREIVIRIEDLDKEWFKKIQQAGRKVIR